MCGGAAGADGAACDLGAGARRRPLRQLAAQALVRELHSEYGQCCSDADGYVFADVDWESDKGRYRVHLDGEWVLVPDGAVITEPNKIGRTMVWKHYVDGHPRVRCFMPGSMT